jgi:hypothetical protein
MGNGAGVNEAAAKETVTALLSMPVVTIDSAEFLVEGEEGSAQVLEEDVVTLAVRLILKRPSHRNTGGIHDRVW